MIEMKILIRFLSNPNFAIRALGWTAHGLNLQICVFLNNGHNQIVSCQDREPCSLNLEYSFGRTSVQAA